MVWPPLDTFRRLDISYYHEYTNTSDYVYYMVNYTVYQSIILVRNSQHMYLSNYRGHILVSAKLLHTSHTTSIYPSNVILSILLQSLVWIHYWRPATVKSLFTTDYLVYHHISIQNELRKISHLFTSQMGYIQFVPYLLITLRYPIIIFRMIFGHCLTC